MNVATTLDKRGVAVAAGLAHTDALIQAQGIVKIYPTVSGEPVLALDHLDMAVRDGREPTVRSKGKAVPEAHLQEIPLTIPALFAFAIEWSRLGQVDVEIDPTHGYPSRVSVEDNRPEAVQHETIEAVAFTVR